MTLQVIDTNWLGNDRANMVDKLEETKNLSFRHFVIFDGRLYQSFLKSNEIEKQFD